MSRAAFLSLLEAGDVEGLRKAWGEISPHLPQPETYAQAEITMHMARTSHEQVSLKARAWSHRWLEERSFPSQLPDALKPKAERIYPRVASAVGISVNSDNQYIKPILGEVRQSMEHAVLEAEADGKLEDSNHVYSRMMDAKDRTFRQLLGRRS